jgi:hypothetical protein
MKYVKTSDLEVLEHKEHPTSIVKTRTMRSHSTSPRTNSGGRKKYTLKNKVFQIIK